MNALAPAKMAQTAYGVQSAPVRTDRGTEYAVFSQITRRMKAAHEAGRVGFPALAAALHDNRRLWTLLATDVASPGNRLPNDVRARILYLAEFTMVHTSKVLAGDEPVDALLDVNVAIMRGLAGNAGVIA